MQILCIDHIHPTVPPLPLGTSNMFSSKLHALSPPPPSPSLTLSPVGAACYNDCSWLGPGNQCYSEFVSIMATLCLEDSVLWHCSLSGDS